MFEFFRFKKIGFFSKEVQLIIIIFLWTFLIIAHYGSLKETGRIDGYSLTSSSLTFVPIYEEMIFRGILLKYFYTEYGKLKSILITSFLFSLWHFKNILFFETNSPHIVFAQMLDTGLTTGPLLAIICLHFKSISIPIMLHFLINFQKCYVYIPKGLSLIFQSL